MPLVLGNGRHLEEEPLASLVLEGGLVELDLDNVVRVSDYASNLGLTASANLTVQTFDQVETSSEELPSPSEITNAVRPVLVSLKRRVSVDGVADEAADGVGVESQEERNEQVVSIPEGLERLLADTGMSSGIHEHHAEQHDMASNATRLGVVDLQGSDRTNLSLLDIVEVDIMS